MSVHALVVLCYSAVVLVIGVLTRRAAARSASDFLVAGRNLGTLVCAVVVAAEWLGGMSTIGVSERAFQTSTLQPVFYNIATATGMVVIGFTVAAHYRRRGVHTVSEMIESIFGSRARTVSAAAFLLAYITLAYVQLQTCASVLAPLFGLDWAPAVIISSALITAYTAMGGMHALAVTGVFYLVTMYFGLGAAFVVGLGRVGGLECLRDALVARGAPADLYNPFSGGIESSAALLLGGVLGGMAAQASIQPVFAARDERTARRASILAGVIVAPFGFLTAFLGLFAASGLILENPSGIDPGSVLPVLLTDPAFVPPLLGGLALAGVLAAILSTVGPVNFAIVTIAVKDIYHGLVRRNADDADILSTSRRLVVVVSLLTVPPAVFLRGAVLDTAYISYAIRAIGAIVILAGLHARRLVTPTGVQLAFAGGTGAVFASLIARENGWFSIDKTFLSVAATVLVLSASTLWRRIRSRRM